MNFLAHIYLSGNDAKTLCGNFIGDGVKGKNANQYSRDVQTGIALHRFIDDYTDNHPVTAEARKIIRPDFRKYSGVVLDVYFDHFLGINWHRYHPEKLEVYVPKIHAVLDDFQPRMPEKTRRFFHYMKSYNWLLNYRDLNSLSDVFHGMARRTPFKSNMEQAVPVLRDKYVDMEQAFITFFPDLEAEAQEYLSEMRR